MTLDLGVGDGRRQNEGIPAPESETSVQISVRNGKPERLSFEWAKMMPFSRPMCLDKSNGSVHPRFLVSAARG